jgi:hypothetical protein
MKSSIFNLDPERIEFLHFSSAITQLCTQYTFPRGKALLAADTSQVFAWALEILQIFHFDNSLRGNCFGSSRGPVFIIDDRTSHSLLQASLEALIAPQHAIALDIRKS